MIISGKLVSSLSNRSDHSFDLFSIASIELHRLPSAETAEKIYLNKEIEELWTDEDRKLFQKLSPEERVFYADYLSTEFETTKFLVEFDENQQSRTGRIRVQSEITEILVQ